MGKVKEALSKISNSSKLLFVLYSLFIIIDIVFLIIWLIVRYEKVFTFIYLNNSLGFICAGLLQFKARKLMLDNDKNKAVYKITGILYIICGVINAFLFIAVGLVKLF